jgi:hypothetical protein
MVAAPEPLRSWPKLRVPSSTRPAVTKKVVLIPNRELCPSVIDGAAPDPLLSWPKLSVPSSTQPAVTKKDMQKKQ